MKTIEEMTAQLRDALIKAVMDDDWTAVYKYCADYSVEMPKKRRVFKAGVYKAAQYCDDIPAEVKDLAAEKCLMLGFTPFVDPNEWEL